MRFVRRATDQLPVRQVLVAGQFGPGEREVGLGRSELGAIRVRLQAHVGGVELGQRLPAADDPGRPL